MRNAQQLIYHLDGEGYHGSIPKLVFPDYIDGNLVSDIDYLRTICTANIETIVYPTGLKELDADVNTDDTKHVILGDKVEEISYGAFSSSIIEEIYMPDSVVEIGDSAFEDTKNLQGIELPMRLAHIGENAFYGSGIRNIKIPDAVVEIGEFAFFYSELESVHLSSNMDKIESSTFAQYKNLKDVYIPEGIESIEVCAFASCTALEYLALPEGLTTIDYHAFEDCYHLKSIYIPASTVDIDPEAFWGCNSELVIMGHTGSAAEDYAREMGMKFENADLWPEVTSAEVGDFSVSVVIRYPEEEELGAMGRSTDEIVLPSYYMGLDGENELLM